MVHDQVFIVIYLFLNRARVKTRVSEPKKDLSKKSSRKSVSGEDSTMECCVMATS